MFNNRINKLGGWAPNVEDNFVNRTGQTLTRGDVVAVDFLATGSTVETMTQFLAETAPDLSIGPLANVVLASSSNDKGWMYVVCLDVSVANNGVGRFGIIGIFDVKLAAGTGAAANVSNGNHLSVLAGQTYLQVKGLGFCIVGLALQDGPTTAAAATKKVLFNGFNSLQTRTINTNVQVKTADYTVLPSESGTTFTTDGAAGTVVFTLPVAIVGMRFEFRVGAAQALRVDPNGTETIALPSTGVQGAAGKYMGCSTNGPTLVIECTKTGQWSVMGFTGTWAVEP